MPTHTQRLTRNAARRLLCLTLLSVASWTGAQNLLVNPNFVGGTRAAWTAGVTVFDAQSASADDSALTSGLIGVGPRPTAQIETYIQLMMP